MAAARFCSECGERLRAKRAGSLLFRSLCDRCAPRSRNQRRALIAVPILCLALGFIVGRYAAKREPFYFIGTPIKLGASGTVSSPDDHRGQSSRPGMALGQEQLVLSPSAVEGICGARTRSGKPCQRKVKGGGYCWQHRDKFGDKKAASQPE